MKRVLLVTDGMVHPPFWARKALVKAFEGLDGFEFISIRSLENLPGDVDSFAAMVLYFHHKEISNEALTTLKDFVLHGGGILGVHSATASFKQEEAYFEILGGRFTGRGPVERFDVTPVIDGTLFDGIPAFRVGDELYIHELQPGIETHFTAIYQGEEIPAVWTYHYGSGRVCYAVPGHTAESLKNSTYQKVLRRGLLWVSKS